MTNNLSYSYLNDYLQQCLGIKDVLLPIIASDMDSSSDSNLDSDAAESFPQGVEDGEALALSSFQLRWEQQQGDGNSRGLRLHGYGPIQERSSEVPFSKLEFQPYVVLFIRRPRTVLARDMGENLESSALDHHPQALELFHKLRQAMNLNAAVAPYVEIGEGDFFMALHHVRSQAHKIIIMADDCLQKGDQQNDWIIPDPTVLERHPHLKRPTWELLKQWLGEA